MISPHDLISLADRLAAIQHEPANAAAAVQRESEGRAAVSRAYYGAFHAAKNLIEDDCGVVLPEGPESHEKLRYCLENSQNDDLASIGGRLKSLRAERNKADYALRESKFAITKNVRMQLERARQIVTDLATVQTQIADIRPSVRTYAGEALRLPLRG